MRDAIIVANVAAGAWKAKADVTPAYMRPERADGKQPGVIYREDLEGAFRGLQAATWKAGSVRDLAA
jgi:hypothetical protein